MALLEQPDSLYNKTIIAYIVDLITKDPFRKKIIKFLNIIVKCGSLDNGDFQIDWKLEIKKIIKSVENFNLPLNIKQDIKHRFFPICFEIKAWMEHYTKITGLCYELSKILDSLCWTCSGIINVDKTWKKFVNNGFIGDSTFNKYRYACHNCREEDIRILWRRLQRTNEAVSIYSEVNGSKYNLVTYWNFYMSNRLNELINDGRSENVIGLNIAMQQGNASVIKYFWNKLTPEEKETNLLICFKNFIPEPFCFVVLTRISRIDNSKLHKFTPRSSVCSNLYFFLRQLSNEHARIIFGNININLYELLSCFIDFPFRNLFLPVMEYLLRFTEINQNVYVLLLKRIAINLIGDPKTYSKLFEYIWRNKIHDKDGEMQNSNWGTIMTALLDSESYEHILLIFDNISVETKENFFKNHGSFISSRLINSNKFDVFEWFMKLCLTNKDAVLRFKNYERVRKDLRMNAKIQFINILDRIIISFDN